MRRSAEQIGLTHVSQNDLVFREHVEHLQWTWTCWSWSWTCLSRFIMRFDTSNRPEQVLGECVLEAFDSKDVFQQMILKDQTPTKRHQNCQRHYFQHVL